MVNIYSDCWIMNLLLVLCKYKDLSGSCFLKYYSLLCLLSISKSEYIKSNFAYLVKSIYRMKLSLFLQNIQNVSELKKNYRLEEKETYIYMKNVYLLQF